MQFQSNQCMDKMNFLKRLFRKIIKTNVYGKWIDGLDHELSFWNDWIENPKGDLNWRLLPQKELQEMVTKYLNISERERGIKVLDVGAGPITFLGLLVVNVTYQLFKSFHHKFLIIGSILISIISLVGGQFIVERVFTFSTTLSVIVNFIGGVYFIYLLLKQSKS